MSTKIGKYGFHIRDMGNVQEIYDNKVIEEVYGDDYYCNIVKYKTYIEDQIVLDLGSHVGCMAKLFLECNAKKVICVEPSINHIECLKKNLEKISTEKVEILEGAVDIKSGITTFYEYRNNSAASTIVEKKYINFLSNNENKSAFERVNKICVKTFGFDNLIKYYNPTVVKIDIECFEWKLLQNSPPSPINLMIIEWHNTLYPEYDVRKLPQWINTWNILFDNQKTVLSGQTKHLNSGRDIIIANVL